MIAIHNLNISTFKRQVVGIWKIIITFTPRTRMLNDSKPLALHTLKICYMQISEITVLLNAGNTIF